jgi:N-alpha-acetyltransferase 15/16, NatA auxiliary subunit
VLARPYITSRLNKGIPSLFVDLKPLYASPEKRSVIESIISELQATLKPLEGSSQSDEPPTTYLWTLYFLVQHHSHLGDQAKALALVEEALAHTPTLPELYSAKARILKRAGDPFGAAQAAEQARELDGQDRFLNTKAAKYLLRAGLIDEAQTVLGLFTKVCFLLSPW